MPDTIINITEEPYTDIINELINKWKGECEEFENIHNELSDIYNHKFIGFSLVSLILPIVLTFASQIIEDDYANTIVSGCGFMIVAIANGLLSFLALKSKSKDHEFAAYRYNTLINTIESNQSRGEKYRTPADVLVTIIKTEIKNIQVYSPRISGNCICH